MLVGTGESLSSKQQFAKLLREDASTVIMLEIPTAPGLGADLNLEEVKRHPYQETGGMLLFEPDWQFRRPERSGS